MAPESASLDNTKMLVIYRVEPGCLGPDGVDHIEAFCQFAQTQFDKLDTHIVCWNIIPRYDKSLAEVEYRLNNKLLSENHTDTYLQHHQTDLDNFEVRLSDRLARLIDHFLDNKK